jgi:type IV secretory pathway TraG/TraD family ATPase VirD4
MPDPLFRSVWRSLRLSSKAAQGITHATVAGVEAARAHRGAQAARRGVVGPDDQPPPPELVAQTYDYRGLARPQDLRLSPWAYRLGQLREPGRSWKLLEGEFGLADSEIARHAAVIGPSRSGKTSSIAVPWIYGALASGRSVIAADVSGELWPALREYGATLGTLNIKVFHWSYADPRNSCSWRWLDELDGEDAVEAAVEAILGRERANDPAPFRHQRDMRYLSALLKLVRARPQPAVARLLDALVDPSRFRAFLSAFPRGDAVRDLSELLALTPDQFAGAVSGVLNGLRPLATPAVRKVTETSGFTLDMLSGRPSLLVVGAPATGARTTQSTLGLLLALAANRWLGGPTGRRTPLLLMLDEAPCIQERVNLVTLLSRGGSTDVAVVLSAQSVTQFAEEDREEILSNCATMIMLPGTGRASTDDFAERVGQRAALGLTRSVQRNSIWTAPQRGLSSANELAPMIGHRELSMPPFEGYPAIVHASSLGPRPILVDLTREDL